MSSKILNFFQIDSTSLEARRIIDSNFTQNNVIITAQKQTQGRGRLDRNWVSLYGNMMFSIIIPQAWVKKESTLPACISLAILGEISLNSEKNDQKLASEFAQKMCYVKWPNDLIIIDGSTPKKFCGILIEKYHGFFIIGIGINTEKSPDSNTLFPSTNLKYHDMRVSNAEKINDSFLQMLNKNQNDILSRWREKHYFQGKTVKIGDYDGIFEDVDENFSVILNKNGERKVITFGDVS